MFITDVKVASLMTQCAQFIDPKNDLSSEIQEIIHKVKFMWRHKIQISNNLYVPNRILENEICWVVYYDPPNFGAYFFDKYPWPLSWTFIGYHTNQTLEGRIRKPTKPIIEYTIGDQTILFNLTNDYLYPVNFWRNKNINNIIIKDVIQIFWKSKTNRTYTIVENMDYIDITTKFKNLNPHNYGLKNIVEFWEINKSITTKNHIFDIFAEYIDIYYQLVSDIKQNNVTDHQFLKQMKSSSLNYLKFIKSLSPEDFDFLLSKTIKQ